MSRAAFLPYAQHSIDESDVEAVAAVLRGGALTGVPAVAALEREFTRRFGAKHAVVCSSGTAALHLAALALGWGAGDTVSQHHSPAPGQPVRSRHPADHDQRHR